MNKFFIGRFVLQTKTPLAIHSGERTVGRDSAIATDWNNLPYLPATAITGVWRTILDCSEKLDEKTIEKWFGNSGLNESSASRFIITDGLMLDSKSSINFGLLNTESFARDELYCRFSNVHNIKNRERTSINARGASKNSAKFDTAILPVGLRFTFDVEAVIEEGEENELRSMIQLLADRGFALGSNISNGFGAFSIIGFKHLCFDIADISKKSDELNKFRLNCRPLENIETNYIDLNPEQSLKLASLVKLKLKGRDTWLIGSQTSKDRKNESYTEYYLVWNRSNCFEQEKNRIVIMGSTIKGLILHRTLYHYFKLKKVFAEEFFDNPTNKDTEYSFDLLKTFGKDVIKSFIELFGYASTQGDGSTAIASKLVVPDVYIDSTFQIITRTHNKIDRLSGGTMSTALFSENRIYQPEFTIEVDIQKKYKFKDPEIKEALRRTLIDIAEGYLPISTGSGRQAGITRAEQGYKLSELLD
ncbi:MAG: hypothetical protein J6P43_08605 [Succinivibrionaceae bacterium]|nr:hypothetical protein [Succinivibrionaceae bacterium]